MFRSSSGLAMFLPTSYPLEIMESRGSAECAKPGSMVLTGDAQGIPVHGGDDQFGRSCGSRIEVRASRRLKRLRPVASSSALK